MMTNQLLEMSDWREREREGQADRDVCCLLNDLNVNVNV
jgi:hypothetical protein